MHTMQQVMSAAIMPATGAFTAEVTPAALRGQAGSLQRQAADVLSLTAPISLGLVRAARGTLHSLTDVPDASAECYIGAILSE